MGAANRAQNQRRTYRRRREAGLCVSCPNPAVPGKARCEGCAAKERAVAKERYRARKAAGVCTYTGCFAPLKEGAQMCARHAALNAERSYRSAAERAARGGT